MDDFAINMEIADADSLRAEAFVRRDRGDMAGAEVAFGVGMQRFPDHLDQYGHPTFRKELIRTLLGRREWSRAEALIPAPSGPGGDHWHTILFARACREAGDEAAAAQWFEQVAAFLPEALGLKPLTGLSAPDLLKDALGRLNHGNISGAEEALRLGMQRFPDHLDQYGHPTFRKELIRTLLGRREWSRAEALIPAPSGPGGDHWHTILFARAYAEAGDIAEATRWWSRVSAGNPANGEAEAFFERMALVGNQCDEAAALRAEAIRLRDSGDKMQAEVLFTQGMEYYPNYLDNYGHPTFRKELMRMLLDSREWRKAEALVPVSGGPGGNHWHYAIFAQAYEQADDAGLAVGMHRMASIGSILADFNTLKRRISNSLTQVHPFMEKFFKFKGMTASQTISRFHSFVEQAEAKLYNKHDPRSLASSKTKIPKILHRVWLTNLQAPCEPPSNYIDSYIDLAKSADDPEWKFTLWIQDEKLLPSTLSAIRSAGQPIAIKHIFDEIPTGRWTDLLNVFIRDRKYPFAADVLRMKILKEFGGIYADMGAKFSNNFARDVVMKDFKYAFIFWDNLFFQNSLMAMPPSTELADAYMRIVEDPYILPKEIISPLTGSSEGNAFSGLMITALLLSLPLGDGDVCPLLSNGKIVSWSSQQSWYTNTGKGEGKFGNVYVPDSAPSFLCREGWESRQGSIFDNIITDQA
ncbi:glycosyltransferase [Azospirillum brasilense]|uniref:glycosyltransferase n=1 Tax=Azospirillum brasilense TaxID=192 RepID=UPI000E0AE774|nr:glycosyltransferase [Azospirillum brasilense]